MNSYGRGGGFLSSIPPIVKNLIIINLLILIATQVERFKLPMYEYLALFYPQSPFFKPHQLFTHMFMHGDFFHLFFNMYALWIFGSPLERTWGSKRFLIFYIVTGIGAALFYILVQWVQITYFGGNLYDAMTIPMVGASGAIFGVLLGFGMLFPNVILQLIFPPVRLKAKYFVMIYGAIELYLSIQQPGDSVAHVAHVGGMIFGYILIRLWKKKSMNRYWS